MHFIRKRNSRLITMSEHFKVGCTFQVQKFRNDGTIIYQGPEFSNLVLDVGLDSMNARIFALADGVARYINIGTGSSSPATTQTGLDTYLASSNALYGDRTDHYESTSPRHKRQEATFEFAVGNATGNLTEVGLSAGSNANYFNRQLFKDEAGNPTTITVLSDEGLRIATKLFLYGDIEPGETETGSFLLNGTDTIDFTREMTSDATWLAQVRNGHMLDTGDASVINLTDSATAFDVDGYSSSANSTTKDTYTTGDFYWTAQSTWDPATYVGDIASILFQVSIDSTLYAYSAFRLSPVISITDTDEFVLNYKRSWGRYVA